MKTTNLPVGVYKNGNTSYTAIVRHKKIRHYLGSFPTVKEARERVELFREHHPIERNRTPHWQPVDEL